MRSMARAILLGGIVVATTAVGDTPALPDAAEGADQQVTAESSGIYAEPQPQATEAGGGAAQEVAVAADGPGDRPAESSAQVASNPPAASRVPMVMTVALAFPSSSDDAGYRLPARITRADLYPSKGVVNVASAFPTSTDDAGYYLVASRTHADIFLDRTRVAQAEPRGASTGAD